MFEWELQHGVLLMRSVPVLVLCFMVMVGERTWCSRCGYSCNTSYRAISWKSCWVARFLIVSSLEQRLLCECPADLRLWDWLWRSDSPVRDLIWGEWPHERGPSDIKLKPVLACAHLKERNASLCFVLLVLSDDVCLSSLKISCCRNRIHAALTCCYICCYTLFAPDSSVVWELF